MTVFFRIDDRLLHSEVIYACLPVHRPDHVIVATSLPYRSMVDRSIMPGDMRLTVAGPLELLAALVPAEKTFVIFGTLLDLAAAWSPSLPLQQVTLGNRARRRGTRRLCAGFFLDEEEIDVLMRLVNTGVDVLAQSTPSVPGLPVGRQELEALEKDPPRP